jgi:hypothetical protein
MRTASKLQSLASSFGSEQQKWAFFQFPKNRSWALSKLRKEGTQRFSLEEQDLGT